MHVHGISIAFIALWLEWFASQPARASVHSARPALKQLAVAAQLLLEKRCRTSKPRDGQMHWMTQTTNPAGQAATSPTKAPRSSRELGNYHPSRKCRRCGCRPASWPTLTRPTRRNHNDPLETPGGFHVKALRPGCTGAPATPGWQDCTATGHRCGWSTSWLSTCTPRSSAPCRGSN